MIIFRVTTGRSFTKLPSAVDSVLSNPIQFARETEKSSFLQSTLNREFARNFDREQGSNTSIVTHIEQKTRKDSGGVVQNLRLAYLYSSSVCFLLIVLIFQSDFVSCRAAAPSTS
jgi:hypothetical protein